MILDIPQNPNCPATDSVVFSPLGEPRPIRAIKVFHEGRDTVCDVVGAAPGGSWTRASACKIADSGEGTAYLISGGEWGIRLRPETHAGEPWDLKNKNQWGEPYKIYGSQDDILFD